MPEYVSNASDSVFNQVESLFINTSQNLQGTKFLNEFYNNYNKASGNQLFTN